MIKLKKILKEMKINLESQLQEEIEYFIEVFNNNGWFREDQAYITKKTSFVINPTSKNEDSKYTLGLVLYPELLSYGDESKTGNYITTPWINCRFELEYNKLNENIVDSVAKFLLDELKTMNIFPFKDEDALYGFLTRSKNKQGYNQHSFYINRDYPKGHWYNHTLD